MKSTSDFIEPLASPIHVALVDESIGAEGLRDRIRDPDNGALAWFDGVTRRTTGELVTDRLFYQAHRRMALASLRHLAERAIRRFDLSRVVIVHRLGDVPVGDASVTVGCGAAHRAAVFAALPWIMDELKRDVPIWKRETFADGKRAWVHPKPARIYLDHAATSWPKSSAALGAMDDYLRDCGAAAGRGSYASAMKAGGIVASLRRRLNNLVGGDDPSGLTLHGGGTAALNAAIAGIVRPGDHVVTTAAEHNSVLRPLKHLGVDLTVVRVDARGVVAAADVIAALRRDTRMVAITSASNVTGAVAPIGEIGTLLGDHPAAFLVDAAQTIGLLPIDVAAARIDLLAAPGHKGLGGPPGTGCLYVAPRLHDRIRPSMFGGTGSQSESVEMPAALPSKLEPGNLNVPALAGWLAAIDPYRSVDAGTLGNRLTALSNRLHDGLAGIDSVRLQSQPGPLPLASFTLEGWSPHDVAATLDAEFGIEVRSGYHCAAMIHESIGSASEGTVRISGGPATTDQEIDAAIDAVKQLAAANPKVG